MPRYVYAAPRYEALRRFFFFSLPADTLLCRRFSRHADAACYAMLLLFDAAYLRRFTALRLMPLMARYFRYCSSTLFFSASLPFTSRPLP